MEECQIAHAVGAPTQVCIRNFPSMDQKVAVLTDRLRAVSHLIQGDLRTRWHGLLDRCRDVVIIWSGLKCAMLFREMVISGMGMSSEGAADTSRGAPLTRSTIDRGILKCALGILGSREMRSTTIDYLAASATLRQRAALRTSNKAPQATSMEDVPWKGGAAVAVLHASTKACGSYISELNETILSLGSGRFTLSFDPEGGYCDYRRIEFEKRMVENGAQVPLDEIPRPTKGILDFCQPGHMLLEIMGNRMRSQAHASFGLHGFAGLLHPNEQVAELKYDMLKSRCLKLQEVLQSESATDSMPTGLFGDLKRIFRDDLFLEASSLLLKTRDVHCCRLYFVKKVPSQPTTHLGVDQENEGQTGEDLLTQCLEAPGWNNTTQPMDFDPPPKPGNKTPELRMCPQDCPCAGAGVKISTLLQSLFTGCFGTKWNIENGFNTIRKLRESCSRVSRGAAELGMMTKHACIHANSLQNIGASKYKPISLKNTDWEFSHIKVGAIKQLSETLFSANGKESGGPFTTTMKTMLGLNKRIKRTSGAELDFTATPPIDFSRRRVRNWYR